MSTLIAVQDLALTLGQLKERTEIRDAQGNILGIFTPQEVADQERWQGIFDLQEAERVLAEERDKGKPLAEVWEDIKASGSAVRRKEEIAKKTPVKES